jgi:hypothetical protein
MINSMQSNRPLEVYTLFYRDFYKALGNLLWGFSLCKIHELDWLYPLMKLEEGCIIFIWVSGVRRNYPFHQNEFSTRNIIWKIGYLPFCSLLNIIIPCVWSKNMFLVHPNFNTWPYELQIYNQDIMKIRLH